MALSENRVAPRFPIQNIQYYHMASLRGIPHFPTYPTYWRCLFLNCPLGFHDSAEPVPLFRTLTNPQMARSVSIASGRIHEIISILIILVARVLNHPHVS